MRSGARPDRSVEVAKAIDPTGIREKHTTNSESTCVHPWIMHRSRSAGRRWVPVHDVCWRTERPVEEVFPEMVLATVDENGPAKIDSMATTILPIDDETILQNLACRRWPQRPWFTSSPFARRPARSGGVRASCTIPNDILIAQRIWESGHADLAAGRSHSEKSPFRCPSSPNHKSR